ncbi:MAG: thioredoxin family protein [Bacillus sp. (in: firmicutes)]
MKKVLIFIGVIVVIFAGLIIVNNMSNSEKLANNPYKTDDLEQSTIDLLEDENYQNIILPGELEDKLQEKGTEIVYFFSPECGYCKQSTPHVMAAADEQDVEVHQYNILEFTEGWNKYNIESTPTLIIYKDGKEVTRATGSLEGQEAYEAFFKENL